MVLGLGHSLNILLLLIYIYARVSVCVYIISIVSAEIFMFT